MRLHRPPRLQAIANALGLPIAKVKNWELSLGASKTHPSSVIPSAVLKVCQDGAQKQKPRKRSPEMG